jgi:hypothetical protein
LQANLHEADFLRACVALNERNIIVWVVDTAKNIRIELEWNPLSGAFVPAAERMAMLDSSYEIDLLEVGRAKVRHLLSEDTKSLTEEVSLS